jgi:hypothetical protein
MSYLEVSRQLLTMPNVTYLLGAGASCNCLPTYQNFGARFRLFYEAVGKEKIQGPMHLREVAEEIETLCASVLEEFKYHNTPDTIAKKYYHQKEGGKVNLNNLKLVLTLYFIFEQVASDEFVTSLNKGKDAGKSGVIDKRYDSFIASILKPTYSEVEINPSINILTWNYDSQFEICFQNYLDGPFTDAQRALQSTPSVYTIQPSYDVDQLKSSIVHLNGIAYSELSGSGPFSDAKPYSTSDGGQILQVLAQHYSKMKADGQASGGKRYLNFAWERDDSCPFPKDVSDVIIKRAVDIARKTNILVVIGYSFPIFNRGTDEMLLHEMKHLEKVYFQSPDAVSQAVSFTSTFSLTNHRIAQRSVIPITNTAYFHIPNELTAPERAKYSIA